MPIATERAAALLLAMLLPGTAMAQAGGWRLSEHPEAWRTVGFDEDKDLSGIASPDGRQVLVVSDETVAVQPGVLERKSGTITAGVPVPLPMGARDGKSEADVEGVAWMPEEKAWYVTGSHGLGKKKADFQESRCHVFRIPADPASGRPMTDGITRASLLPWAEREPSLQPYVRKPLQQNGFNIEGLAAKDGKLWFGLRGPNVDGAAFVVSVPPAALFRDGGNGAVVHRFATGPGTGIRELAALRDGFVVLTGNASAETSKQQPKSEAPGPDVNFALWHWQPGGAPVKLGDLPQPPGKGEGLLVLEDTEDHADVLVLHDGISGGAPRVHRLTRPTPATR